MATADRGRSRLTPKQAQALAVLCSDGRYVVMSGTYVARRIGTTESGAVRALRCLQRKGLVDAYVHGNGTVWADMVQWIVSPVGWETQQSAPASSSFPRKNA